MPATMEVSAANIVALLAFPNSITSVIGRQETKFATKVCQTNLVNCSIFKHGAVCGWGACSGRVVRGKMALWGKMPHGLISVPSASTTICLSYHFAETSSEFLTNLHLFWMLISFLVRINSISYRY